MKQSSLAELVCRGYCFYYKPSSGEELACRGFSIAEKLLAEGIDVLPDACMPLPDTMDRAHSPSDAAADLLVNALCPGCPFQEADCDFAEAVRTGSAPRTGPMPCGGFLFLGRLIDEGAITPDAVRRITRE